MGDAAQYVGIDVSKGWLDLAERPSGRTWRIPNTEEGWAELVTEVTAAPGSVLVVLEATGGYEVGVVVALDRAGQTPVVANPISTRRFAQSLGKRGKTDRLDAAMLAEYAERMQPTPRPIPAETARTLQELLTRRRQLTKLHTQETNRSKGASALIQPQVTQLLAMLKAQRKEIDTLLASSVASDPSWQERVDQLDTVPGLGVYMATLVAVGIPELGACTAKEVAALVGVAPHPRESGQVRGPRRISAGRGPIRHALFEAMLSTRRCDPTFAAHYAQLRARGKSYKQATIACIRRLLGILTAMVRDHLTWEETKVGQGTFLPPTA